MRQTTNPAGPAESGALMTRDQAAAWLGGIHVRSLDRLRARGELPAVAIGRRWFYRPETLERYVRSREA